MDEMATSEHTPSGEKAFRRGVLSRFGYRRLDSSSAAAPGAALNSGLSNLTDALDAPYEPYADMFLFHMFTT